MTPLNIYAIDDVHFITQKQVEPAITNSSAIDRAIEVYFSQQTTDKAIEDLKREYSDIAGVKVDQAVLDDIQSAPAVRLTNAIITQAITIRASDIHIEPFSVTDHGALPRRRCASFPERRSRKTFIQPFPPASRSWRAMNIAEKRLPLDGRIEMEQNGKNYDFRVSSLPTVFGEKIAIRILDRGGVIYTRDMMHFTDHENGMVDRIIKSPYGIVLLTGPTGSGKTTTLYAFLNELNRPDRNIVTVEDPVEYMLDGVNQVHVNNKAGLTFARGLRAILRQDPDVIMVGEIRDEETAEVAVRAAITGHLVLSTLHTRRRPGRRHPSGRYGHPAVPRGRLDGGRHRAEAGAPPVQFLQEGLQGRRGGTAYAPYRQARHALPRRRLPGMRRLGLQGAPRHPRDHDGRQRHAYAY